MGGAFRPFKAAAPNQQNKVNSGGGHGMKGSEETTAPPTTGRGRKQMSWASRVALRAAGPAATIHSSGDWLVPGR
jgi:hypothetical protein